MYELQVEGMTCMRCVGRVTKAVQSVDQAAEVEVDLPSKTVRIQTAATLAAIEAAIAQAAYAITARHSF